MLIASRSKVFIAPVHFRGILALINNSLYRRPLFFWPRPPTWHALLTTVTDMCSTLEMYLLAAVVSTSRHVSAAVNVSETLTFVWNASAGADNWMKTLAENFVCKTNHWNGKTTASSSCLHSKNPKRKINTKRGRGGQYNCRADRLSPLQKTSNAFFSMLLSYYFYFLLLWRKLLMRSDWAYT